MIGLPRKARSVASRVLRDWRTARSFDSHPLADLSLLEEGLTDRTNPIDSQYHEALVNRLLISYHKAKALQENLPLAYKPGRGWDEIIKTTRADYLRVLNDSDITGLSDLLKCFFRNSGIDSLWAWSRYSDIADGNTLQKKSFVNRFLGDYERWKEFVDEGDISTLSSPAVGNPWGYIIQGNLLLPVSFRHNYYADRVHNLLADIEVPVVAEIGGGFGGFAYHLLSTGKRIKYIDFDLPEILMLASYYLMNTFPNKRFLLFGESEDVTISEDFIESHDVILMPNFQLPKLSSESVDLFMNSASLSEMDYPQIEEYIIQVVRTCKLFFFHDNVDLGVLPYLRGAGQIPSSRFPIPKGAFKRIYKSLGLWSDAGGIYREHLYQRL